MLLPPLNQEKDRPMTKHVLISPDMETVALHNSRAAAEEMLLNLELREDETREEWLEMCFEDGWMLHAITDDATPTGFDAIPADWDDFTKNEVFDLICDILGDCNRRDTVAMVTENWTQADWENQLADMNDDE